MDDPEGLRTGWNELQGHPERATWKGLQIDGSEPTKNTQEVPVNDDLEEMSNSPNKAQSGFPNPSSDISTLSKNEGQNFNPEKEQAGEVNDSPPTNSSRTLEVYDVNKLTRKFKSNKGCDYEPSISKPISPTSTELCTLTDMPPELSFVSREDWRAISPKRVSSKPHVTSVVVFTYTTNSDACFTRKKCEKVIRKLQRYHMRGGLPDIPYNFMVGGDGRVYEGRGWFANPRTLVQLRQLRGHIIEIAYLGDYRVERPGDAMFDAALELVDYGRKNFWIKERFGLYENYESMDINPIDLEL